MDIKYEWTDGRNPVFEEFYKITEDYYSKIVGGLQNRRSFVPYNVITDIKDVLIAYNKDETPVACASFKKYSETDAEIKRVWVEPEYRGNHIAYEMMLKIQERANVWRSLFCKKFGIGFWNKFYLNCLCGWQDCNYLIISNKQ